MKILVLENDPQELSLIQQAASQNGKNTLIPIQSSEQAWPHIQSGEVHFLIGNWDTSDMRGREFISRVRAAKNGAFYILLTTSKEVDDIHTPTDADDVIHRPLKMRDLKNRIAMAERIISLADSLATARNQLENHAIFDSLTGFMNRAAFLRQATGEMERARRSSDPISLIALDIDNFKTINEKFGVHMGDEILKVTSQSIQEKSRPYDCIGRWTGDEFIILVIGVIGADAEKISERIIAGVRGTRIEVQGEAPVSVNLSAGIASVARIGTSTEVEELIQKARQAMARAKEAGGNQTFLVYV